MAFQKEPVTSNPVPVRFPGECCEHSPAQLLGAAGPLGTSPGLSGGRRPWVWRALESRPLPPSTSHFRHRRPPPRPGLGQEQGRPLQGPPGERPLYPLSLRSVPVDTGIRCVGRGLASSRPGLVCIGKVAREFMSGPNTDPSPKVKVWELAGEVIRGGYLHVREKGVTISMCVSTLCASSTSPSLYFRKLAL
ncbi:hypothetical protein HJG60_011054 [Phyllostomus discolor]|uniref:Uncharacterized protein n=1 Tax=Phyllostomus discolor TaxID=89673 RepID=A0A834A864_9CHIR|nr:hypothetical protein HJG60_011054 [Phyllostomus discolor]